MMSSLISTSFTASAFDTATGFGNCDINLHGLPIERVTNFTYLGSDISDKVTVASADINARIGKANFAFSKLNKCLWRRNEITMKTKMRIFNAIVIPTLIYGAECWTLLAQDAKKLEVFQMSCLRRILNVRLQDRLKNEEIRKRCENQDIVGNKIKSARLRWFGHVCRMEASRLPRKLLQENRPGHWKCPRSAPKKQWKDQVIADLRPLHFNSIDDITEAALNRAQWRGLRRDICEAATSGSGSLPYRR